MVWRNNIFTSAWVCHVVLPAGRDSVRWILMCGFTAHLLFSKKLYVLWLLPSEHTSEAIVNVIWDVNTLQTIKRCLYCYCCCSDFTSLSRVQVSCLRLLLFYFLLEYIYTLIPWSLPLVTADEWQYHMICQTNWNSHISLKNNWFVTISAFHKNHSVGGNIGCATYQQYTVQIKLL